EGAAAGEEVQLARELAGAEDGHRLFPVGHEAVDLDLTAHHHVDARRLRARLEEDLAGPHVAALAVAGASVQLCRAEAREQPVLRGGDRGREQGLRFGRRHPPSLVAPPCGVDPGFGGGSRTSVEVCAALAALRSAFTSLERRAVLKLRL